MSRFKGLNHGLYQIGNSLIIYNYAERIDDIQRKVKDAKPEELGGKLSYWMYADKYSTSQKIVIEYGYAKKD